MTNYQTKQKPFHNHFSLSLLLIISLKICNIGKYEYQVEQFSEWARRKFLRTSKVDGDN